MRDLVVSSDLLPAGVIVRGLELDPPTEATLLAFDGIAIPEALRTAIAKRRVDFAAGRFCARAAMRACAPDVADHSVEMGPDRAPVWPRGVVGSIAHTAGHAIAAVARAEDVRAVGIDVERWMSPGANERVGGHIARGDELASLARRSGWPDEEILTLIFSAKETLYKCLYPEVGRWFGFHDARIVDVDPVARTFEAALLVPLSATLIPDTRLRGRFERKGAVVVTAIAR